MTLASLRKRLGRASPRQGLVRSVAVLASGSVLGQAIMVLGSPLLTRLYSPEEFGVFATFGGMLVVVGTISALGYHVAIPVPDDDREAVDLVVISTSLCCLISAVVLGVVFLFDLLATPLAMLDGSIAEWLWLLPLALLLSGLYEISRLWNVRQKNYSALSIFEANQRLAALVVQVVLGLLGFAAGGLIAGMLGGLSASLVALLLWTCRGTCRARRPRLGDVSASRLLFLARKYRQFALYRCPSGLVFWAGRCAPLLFLPWLFGPMATGLYALTDRVLQTPMAFVVTHIQSVFLSSCTELKAAGRLADAGSSLLRAQVWLGFPAFAISAIIAPDVFALVFGEAWRSAGTYAQLLMPSIFLSFIALPLNAFPIAFEKQQGELLFQSGMALARCVGLLIGGAFDSIQLAIVLLSAATGAGWLLYLFWTMSLAGHRPGEVLRALVRECTLSIPCILPVGLAKIVMNANSPGWLMAVAAFCLVLSFGVVALRAMPMTALANSR